MFHPIHRLFSRLRNHSMVGLTIPLSDYVFCLFVVVVVFFWWGGGRCLFRLISLIAFPDVNKHKRVAEMTPLHLCYQKDNNVIMFTYLEFSPGRTISQTDRESLVHNNQLQRPFSQSRSSFHSHC